MANQYGLIGYPLGHSFSKKYFEEKFGKLQSSDAYSLFEMKKLAEFSTLINTQKLSGLNVTIPYKQEIIEHLSTLDRSAKLVGAVNVIKIKGTDLEGYNTDYPAFKETLKKWLDNTNIKALVLGTGGASKAVIAALQDLKIQSQLVSRNASEKAISYEELANNSNFLSDYKLVINTTPLGTSPKIDSKPEIPYQLLTPSHYLYDLVYNPEKTQFLKEGEKRGSHIKNGLEMLALQAELAWEIWNS